jgi:hypothetical protein
MRGMTIGLALAAMLFATSASAYDAYDPANCNGVDWNDKQVLVVAQVTAAHRVNFIKSPYDDDFTAASCPAATDACRKTSYLVPKDLVMAGKTRGDFTCVAYQSPSGKKRNWTRGWLPSGALTPLTPMSSPQAADWIGSWQIPGGNIEIKRGDGGKLHVAGEMIVPGAQDVHSGVIGAQVMPGKDTLAFVDDGDIPFEQQNEGECRVRMQRIGALLMVEDNGGCGGVGVTFSGLYHRKK